jgi:hypothetical protein
MTLADIVAKHKATPAHGALLERFFKTQLLPV